MSDGREEEVAVGDTGVSPGQAPGGDSDGLDTRLAGLRDSLARESPVKLTALELAQLLHYPDANPTARRELAQVLAQHGMCTKPDLRWAWVNASTAITVCLRPAGSQAEVSLAGVVAAALSGAAMIVAALLPFAGANADGDTLVHDRFVDHYGWTFILVGALIAITAINARQRRAATRTPFVLAWGAVLLLIVIGTDQTLRTAQLANGTAELLPLGLGFDVAVVASIVAVIAAAALMRAPRVQPARGQADGRRA